MSDYKRQHEPFKVVPPLRLEDVRPCDLVICQECRAVRHVGDLDLEKRQPDWFQEEVEGVFCPGCGQLLFDRKGWIAHKVEQGMWDARQSEQDEEGQRLRSRPLAVAAAVDESE